MNEATVQNCRCGAPDREREEASKRTDRCRECCNQFDTKDTRIGTQTHKASAGNGLAREAQRTYSTLTLLYQYVLSHTHDEHVRCTARSVVR